MCSLASRRMSYCSRQEFLSEDCSLLLVVSVWHRKRSAWLFSAVQRNVFTKQPFHWKVFKREKFVKTYAKASSLKTSKTKEIINRRMAALKEQSLKVAGNLPVVRLKIIKILLPKRFSSALKLLGNVFDRRKAECLFRS